MRGLVGAVVVSFGVLGFAAGAVATGQQAGQTQGGRSGQADPAGRGQGRGAPQPTTNLQVLPKDWTTQQVVPVMRTFTAALGVECSYCHVSQQDRASDDKPEKLKARTMLKMVAAINDEYLKDVGEPAPAGQQKVTCYTCHRGSLKPLTAPVSGGD
jgi:Photosynthetic reaction centre cytochrome C subunit